MNMKEAFSRNNFCLNRTRHRKCLLMITMFLILLGVMTFKLPVSAYADFEVAYTTKVEYASSVAYNSQTNEFLVAYLEPVSDGGGLHYELRVQRFNSSGQKIGGLLYPLGNGTHHALGRPAIAYSPNSNRFFVAVPERVDGSGGTYDRVIGRFLSGDGSNLIGPDFLFDDDSLYATFYPGQSEFDVGSLRVTHNSLLDHFVVTFQRTIAGNNQVWAQRISYVSGLIGSAVKLTDTNVTGFESHGIAHAPVAGTSPSGGRYLYTVQGILMLLDASLTPMVVTETDPNQPGVPTSSNIYINHGKPEGDCEHFDIAYGEIEGQKRFLVIWSDKDNCKPGIDSCPDSEPEKQWAGVWGTYIDPQKLLYYGLTSTHENTPFPISRMWWHVANHYYKPQIAYNPTAKAFFVVWYELPADHPLNDLNLSHIRGTYIDFFVPDGLYNTMGMIQEPPDSTPISDVTGTCQTVWPYICYSNEDPDLPDVAAVEGNSAVAVWHQHYPPNPADLDVWGDFFTAPLPDNDDTGSAETITNPSTFIEGTLVRATNDGSADCDGGAYGPDVWYHYTAPEDGFLTVATCGTHDLLGEDMGMNTVISLHSPDDGSQLPGGFTCNDDFQTGNFPEACLSADTGDKADSALAHYLHQGQMVLIRVTLSGGSPATRFHLNIDFEVANLCEGDFNGDGDVDGSDLAVFAADFGRTDCGSPPPCEGDFNGDGDVDGSDLAVFAADFGRTDCLK